MTDNPNNFKNLPKDKHRELARRGDRAAQAGGKAHAWRDDADGAKEAGRKGGRATQKNRRKNRCNPETEPKS